MANRNQKVIVIVGPTASGKSDLAIRLAKLIQSKPFKERGVLGAEIISADSRQVYRGMDVGTGKVPRDRHKKSYTMHVRSRYKTFKEPDEYYSRGVRHWLIDVASPKRDFSVARFQKLGRKAIADIAKRGKIPIICGGTGLYVDALVYGTSFPEVKPDKHLRARLDKLTAEKLFERLRTLDPARAQTIDRHNKRRLIRALEIIMSTGRPVPTISVAHYHDRGNVQHDILWLGIALPKIILERRIASRLEERFKQGTRPNGHSSGRMIAEVVRLRKHGLSWKRLESFGLEYRWIAQYLSRSARSREVGQNTLSLAEMKKGLLRAIVQYAKRQMTWFKRNPNIHWVKTKSQALRLARRFLKG